MQGDDEGDDDERQYEGDGGRELSELADARIADALPVDGRDDDCQIEEQHRPRHPDRAPDRHQEPLVGQRAAPVVERVQIGQQVAGPAAGHGVQERRDDRDRQVDDHPAEQEGLGEATHANHRKARFIVAR
jgi:hypothetical protein